MQKRRTIQGAHRCRMSLFNSSQWLQQIWIILSLFNCYFKNIFSGNFPPSIILSAAQNHTYKDSVTSESQSNTSLLLQNIFSDASAHSWLRQSRSSCLATIKRYGIPRAVCYQINPNDYGDQNFGGLLALRYSCSRFCQYHSSTYLKGNPFNSEEVRNVCVGK